MFNKPGKQTWADLGCGSGLFSYALTDQLPKDSTIYSVDENVNALKQISATNKVNIQTIHANFTNQLSLTDLDGILMANSLHYVKDKNAFIKKASAYMKKEKIFLIVEYDSDKAVETWVPYPVSFQSLKKLFTEAGYSFVQKLNEHPSVYHNGNIYSALITG